jgi:membrane-associated PAP2 superfamily phosphatase
MHALDFRFFSLFSSLPFMIIAGLESLLRGANFLRDEENDWKYRIMTLRAVAVVFLLVLSVQSMAWFNLTNRLRETIAESRDSCLSLSSIQ